jgi:hypothetical protein
MEQIQLSQISRRNCHVRPVMQLERQYSSEYNSYVYIFVLA